MSKAKRVHVSAEVFVKAVIEAAKKGTGHAGISKLTGIKQTSVATRLSNMRKAGVKLPNFPRGGGGGRKLDVAGLNALIEGK